jgi:hypothetical protein
MARFFVIVYLDGRFLLVPRPLSLVPILYPLQHPVPTDFAQELLVFVE